MIPRQVRIALRWFTGDSPLQDSEQVFQKRSRALRHEGPDPYDESPEADAWIDLVHDAAFQALANLDRKGTFGTDSSDRERLVLSVWGDQTDEERLEFAHALNPAAVAQRFARELEAGNRVFEKICATPEIVG